MRNKGGFTKTIIGSTVCNIALAYLFFMLARVIFYICNISYFQEYMTGSLAWDIFCGGLKFDTTAIIYINAIYILLMLVPCHLKENDSMYKVQRIAYVVLNSIALAMNLADCVYFRYTGRRTTSTVFSEFSNDGNMLNIISKEFAMHWYLVLIFIVLVWAMYRLYRTPNVIYRINLVGYYISLSIALIVTIPLCVVGVRGGIGKAVRPITISNANQYVNRPIETALVLNTPFSLFRTIGKKVFETPNYMSDKEMAELYSPLHTPADSTVFKPKNVVVLILESFGQEYSARLNSDLDGGKYKGYMPFLDSLMSKSLTFQYTFANGRKSIDGMPSSLSGIPMFIEPFFLTPASLNSVSSLAGELDKKNYYTAFFHGAPNGSMGFEAFAKAVGFKDYYGMDEYKADKNRFKEGDYDGTWAIWDEPFLQFYADKMNTFKQPFMTAVFTASSHHPYVIPEQYKNQFPEGPLVIDKCVSYSDMALRKFFEKAEKEPWFKNTIFAITADHTNITSRPEYQTDLGLFKIPVFFYAPGDSTFAAHRSDIIAQQIDIMPTVLNYLGYDKPYITFGQDVRTTAPKDKFAVNYHNGMYQFIKGDYMIQFDGTKTKAVYRFKTDRLLQHNLVGKVPEQAAMERELKAIIQQYMQRMNTDNLVVK